MLRDVKQLVLQLVKQLVCEIVNSCAIQLGIIKYLQVQCTVGSVGQYCIQYCRVRVFTCLYSVCSGHNRHEEHVAKTTNQGALMDKLPTMCPSVTSPEHPGVKNEATNQRSEVTTVNPI